MFHCLSFSLRAPNDTAVCFGNTVLLKATGNADRYSWTPVNGLSDPSSSDPIVSPESSGWYVVEGMTNEGCKLKDSVYVTVNPLPNITLTSDTVICPGTSVQLEATGGTTYSWSQPESLSNPNSASPVASPTNTTSYSVNVVNAFNCAATGTIQVTVRDYPKFTAMGGTTVCNGVSTPLWASGGDRYEWSPVSGLNDPFSPNPVATPLSTTQYSVQIFDTQCNFDTVINLSVGISPTPVVQAIKSNDINCTISSSQLSATGANSYVWTPAIHLDNPNRPNPVARIDSTTLFYVTGTNEYGCTAWDSIRVNVNAVGDPMFVVPNVFTPNNDGLNDCFGISKWMPIQLQELSVYNCWGEKVFSTDNPQICWDGNYRGQPQPSGTFVYLIRARSFCGDVFRKGTITLLR